MESPNPYVIKKVVKKGHGHHGGSWKVAYADFVTAMMAFFLLMWLLGSVNQNDREKIAEYFRRPMKAVLTNGTQSGGDRIIARSEGSSKGGALQPGNHLTVGLEEAQQFQEMVEAFKEEAIENPVLNEFKDQLLIEVTRDGLRIQLVDLLDRPMFPSGSAVLPGHSSRLLRELARFLDRVPFPISISGHTDAAPYGGNRLAYSNWELSAERANAARRALVAAGLGDAKIVRVEGLSSTQLLDENDPFAAENRRISLLILNREAAADLGA